MSQVLGIKFTDYGQIYSFSSGPFVVAAGQLVLVRTEQGMGLGKVVTVRNEQEGAEPEEALTCIYRLANEQDLEAQAENRVLAREAFTLCRECIHNHALDMKLVEVEVFFDRSKMIFYFTAPGRIDFRELIKDLVRQYRTRIELRQIGVRHEAQMLGAIGNCGQLCCCRRFLRKFVPVTIKMAKEQNLFLNPTEISGICGRLLCCLSYEQEAYEAFNRACPKIGKRFRTARGQVKVLRSNFFRKTLSLLFEDGTEEEIPLDDWSALLDGATAVSAPPTSPESGHRGQRGGAGSPPGEGEDPGPGEREAPAASAPKALARPADAASGEEAAPGHAGRPGARSVAGSEAFRRFHRRRKRIRPAPPASDIE